jgi:outer membrane protein assembly factor BamD
MPRKSLSAMIIASVLVAGLGCGGGRPEVAMRPDDRLTLADRLRAEGRCTKAIPEYEKVLSEFPARDVGARARFGLGLCRMELDDYPMAVVEFEDFMGSYPQSDLVDNALYMIALCYYRQSPRPQRDQTNTVKAIDELNLLIREYPESDVRDEAARILAECRSKLAKKEYLNGRLYLDLGYHRSAVVYFDYVLSEYGDTPWAEKALLGKGMALEGQGELEEAAGVYRQVVERFSPGDAASEARSRLETLASVSGSDGSGTGD